MIYAQFYQHATWPTDTLQIIEAVGDRSVIIIDGRLRRPVIAGIANAVCLARGYVAWRIHAGDTFARSRPVSQIWYAHPTNDKPRDPVWLSAHD